MTSKKNLYHPSRSTNYINYPVNENIRNILFWLDFRTSFKILILIILSLGIILIYISGSFFSELYKRWDEGSLLDASDNQEMCYVLIGVEETQALRMGKCLSKFLMKTESMFSKDEFIVTEVSQSYYKEYIWKQLHLGLLPRQKDPLIDKIWLRFLNYVHFYRADSLSYNEEIGDEEIVIQQDILQDVHEAVHKHPVFVYRMPGCSERRKEIIGGLPEFTNLIQAIYGEKGILHCKEL